MLIPVGFPTSIAGIVYSPTYSPPVVICWTLPTLSMINRTSPSMSIALGYINLKSGQVAEGAEDINNVTDMFGEEVYKPYPIKVHLKDSLFDLSSNNIKSFI